MTRATVFHFYLQTMIIHVQSLSLRGIRMLIGAQKQGVLISIGELKLYGAHTLAQNVSKRRNGRDDRDADTLWAETATLSILIVGDETL